MPKQKVPSPKTKNSSRKRSLQKKDWQKNNRARTATESIHNFVELYSIEDEIHAHLVRLDRLEKANRDFWGEYQAFLAVEREKVLDQILLCLWEAKQQNFTLETCGRIVDSAFASRPLCSYGSIIRAGRFNIGGIASYLSDFQALYIASDFDTAFSEKYHRTRTDTEGEGALDAIDLAATTPGSFSYSRLHLQLDSVLDIRDDEVLRQFASIIANIRPSMEIYTKAALIGSERPRTIQTVSELRRALLEENFAQWATWVDQPSPSQWFGLYAHQAGLQGIIYPSVRNKSGFNIAVFPDNLKDSSARISLVDASDVVASNNRFLDRSNYHFQMVSAPEPNGQLH